MRWRIGLGRRRRGCINIVRNNIISYGMLGFLSCFFVAVVVVILHVPLDSNGQFPRAWHRLDDNVVLVDAAGQELSLCALEQRVNDLGVPAGVHDADAQAGAVVLLGGGALHCEVGWLLVVVVVK